MEERTISYEEFNTPRTPLLSEQRSWMAAPIVFGVLTFLMFADVLFTGSRVISHQNTDLSLQFLSWRDFGFGELAKGNLPLWNPHVYGGTPYFAGFQSALLYPPNWVHLILPLNVAINWIVAIHVFLLGYFVYFWCRGNAIGTGGSIVAGIMYMFCGPYFLHLYAGHLPHLAVMVWTPLMLLSLDKLGQSGQWKWLLLGIVATSMHILAGHPQYVYYTGMALAIYTALKLLEAQHRRMLVTGFVGMYVGAVLLTAVQLFAGIEAAGENVRSTGLAYGVASTFSLAPRNLITLIAPNFFSHLPMKVDTVPLTVNDLTTSNLPYWGAGYLWEMSLFGSVTGLILAILAIVRGGEQEKRPMEQLSFEVRLAREARARQHLIVPLAMIFLMFILALGRHTPLYRLMYNYLPGYNGFRGTVKFASLMMLFVSLLAGTGFDGLLRNRRVNFGVVGAVGAAALLLFIFGGIISASGGATSSAWAQHVGNVINEANSSGELFSPNLVNLRFVEKFLSVTSEQAANALVVAGITFLVVAVLLGMARMNALLPYALILLVAVEMFTFARSTRATMTPATLTRVPKPWMDQIDKYTALDKDLRFLTIPLEFANAGMYRDKPFNNLNGYDPGVLRHYAEVIAHSQGEDRTKVSQYLPFKHLNPINKPLFRILRCMIIFPPNLHEAQRVDNPLPMVSLLGAWARLGNEDDLLDVMFSGRWEPQEMALMLANANVPMTPTTGVPGKVTVLDQGTDHLEIEAEVHSPAMLLVTNNYSKGWKVIPQITPPVEQHEYWVMRANYTQIGVPLFPGKHRLLLEYAPTGYRVGWWVSLFSLLGLAGWGILLMRRPGWFR